MCSCTDDAYIPCPESGCEAIKKPSKKERIQQLTEENAKLKAEITTLSARLRLLEESLKGSKSLAAVRNNNFERLSKALEDIRTKAHLALRGESIE